MASLGELQYSIRIRDSQSTPVDRRLQMRFNPLPPNGVTQIVTLTANAFTALSVPAGAQMMVLFLRAAAAVSLTLKGVTGDLGSPLVGATPARFDAQIPISGTTYGIANGAAVNQTIEVLIF